MKTIISISTVIALLFISSLSFAVMPIQYEPSNNSNQSVEVEEQSNSTYLAKWFKKKKTALVKGLMATSILTAVSIITFLITGQGSIYDGGVVLLFLLSFIGTIAFGLTSLILLIVYLIGKNKKTE